MKLIELTMTAFGPYGKTETVDFRSLNDARLFVISGNTGAGKTSIFDAICFVLYGRASGSYRNDSKLLRSALADPNENTSVELVFQIKGRKYKILRRLGLVKPGNKSETGAKQELCVQEGCEWCIIPETTSVKAKVEEVIGLSESQFRQIVMLPQGEFERLLLSNAREKEVIMRKIFNTELYEALTEKLRQEKKACSERYESQKVRVNTIQNTAGELFDDEPLAAVTTLLSQDTYNTIQFLNAIDCDIESIGKHMKEVSEKLGESSEAVAKADGELARARIANASFEKLDRNMEDLKELQGYSESMEDKERVLNAAERAVRIEAIYEQLKELRKDARTKEGELKEANEKQSKALKKNDCVKESYTFELNLENERKDQASLVTTLKSYLPEVKLLEEEAKILEDLESKEKTLSGDQKTLLDELSTEEKKKKKWEDDRDSLSSELVAGSKLAALQAEAKTIKDLIGETARLIRDEKSEREDFDQAEKDLTEQKELHEEVERRWVEGQAAQLAAHLVYGEPCPVCGSVEHPKKAMCNEGLVSKEELENSRNEYGKRTDICQRAKARWESRKDLLEEHWRKLGVYGIEEKNFQEKSDSNLREYKRLSEEQDELTKKSKTLEKLKEDLPELSEAIEKKREKLEEKKKMLDDCQLKKEVTSSGIATIQKRIPKEYQDPKVLERSIEDAESALSSLEESWGKVQKLKIESDNELTKANTVLENAERNFKDISGSVEEKSEAWEKKWGDEGFESEDAFFRARKSREEIDAEREIVQKYKKELHNLENSVRELEEELKDTKRPDINELQDKLDNARLIVGNHQKELNTLDNRKKSAERHRGNIKKEYDLLLRMEDSKNMIDELYKVASGTNAQRISLESYVQREFFKRILHAANERLRKLTDGQFILRHKEEREKGNYPSGLGIEVFDVHIGKSRDVKTLSGGEKFNASLCLALGLYDIIQSSHGGVSMETMFIDEGFGSLDSAEALPKAISMLVEIQQAGRVIGIISHVEDLKNQLPAILQVQKSIDGSSSTKVTVK